MGSFSPPLFRRTLGTSILLCLLGLSRSLVHFSSSFCARTAVAAVREYSC
jgi:hypothetical protein